MGILYYILILVPNTLDDIEPTINLFSDYTLNQNGKGCKSKINIFIMVRIIENCFLGYQVATNSQSQMCGMVEKGKFIIYSAIYLK